VSQALQIGGRAGRKRPWGLFFGELDGENAPTSEYFVHLSLRQLNQIQKMHAELVSEKSHMRVGNWGVFFVRPPKQIAQESDFTMVFPPPYAYKMPKSKSLLSDI